jgi:O-antigen/teichoic acid export membrane protein
MATPTDTLADRTARAAIWRLAGTVVGTSSELAVGVLLARVLPPADFGVMALAFVVLGLGRPLADLGIGGAVVQRAVLTDRHVRTAFTFSALLGLASAVAVAAAAPLGAVVMRDPQVTWVLRVLAVGFAFQGTAVVATALLRRELDFRRQFFIDSGSYLLAYGGVAIPLALTGHGVWSLVWGSLLQAVLASCAQLAAVRHAAYPLLARRELSDLLHFGVGAHGSNCLNYLALNGDNFVVGGCLGAASLGLYSRAYALMNVPYTYGACVMSRVLFPALAQLQGDQERLRRGYLLMTQLTATIAAPVLGAMAIAAPHLVRGLYGSQWDGVVMPLQILCVAGYFRALYHLGGVVAQSVGLVYSELWRQGVYACLVIGGALVGSRFGLSGVATGVSVAILYMFVATAQLAQRATATSWNLYCRVQLGAIVTAAITCGVALSMRFLLEAYQVSSALISLTIVAACGVPWSMGFLWTLGEPGFEPLRSRLPGWCVRVADTMRRRPLPRPVHIT